MRGSSIAIAMLAAFTIGTPASAEVVPVYKGQTVYPNFSGRERSYASYRTRIITEMKTGPNFAGRFAIVEIGCGTGCKFAFVADTSTGRLFDFPYGGEAYYMMGLRYDVKSRYVSASWISEGVCKQESLIFNGAKFVPQGAREIGPSDVCYAL